MTWEFRTYDRAGRIEHRAATFDEIIGYARSTVSEKSTAVIWLADTRYDEQDYNPRTGELYEGTVNEPEIYIGEIYMTEGSTVFTTGDGTDMDISPAPESS